MDYNEDLELDIETQRQTYIAVTMATQFLAQTDLTLGDALDLCFKVRDHVRALAPGADELFDHEYAPGLVALIQRKYD